MDEISKYPWVEALMIRSPTIFEKESDLNVVGNEIKIEWIETPEKHLNQLMKTKTDSTILPQKQHQNQPIFERVLWKFQTFYQE
jgi:hypothetical protein